MAAASAGGRPGAARRTLGGASVAWSVLAASDGELAAVDAPLVSAAAEAGRVVVRVRDRGPGVAEADRERIFDAFERGHGAARGSGLGLAIARGFAEANGGRVWVEPAAASSGGSTFVLALPAAVESAVLPR